METGYIIALIAAVPSVLVTVNAWRSRRVNPLENGTDWIVNQYERAAKREAERAAKLEIENRALEAQLEDERRRRRRL